MATCLGRRRHLCALFDKPRSGRPRILSGEAETEALVSVNQSPRSLKKVIAELAESLGLTLSVSTLKRICKRAGLSWKRVRKSLRSKRDPDLFGSLASNWPRLSNNPNKNKLIYFILTNQVLPWSLASHMLGNLDAKLLKSLVPKVSGLMC